MIETRELTFRYGSQTVLDRISLQIDADEFVLVVGPNGSGKTTLVRHFNALLTPDEGEVLVDGRRAHEDLVATRTTVGMVFQHARDQLVASTVGADVAFGPENLGLSHDEIRRRVDRAVSAVNLDDREDAAVAELSGGERRRTAIAGALAMEPDHLILDEPFAGLDAPSRDSVTHHLDSLHRDGTGIVVVTHDLSDLLDRADRIVALADGRIVADGPPAEVDGDLEPLGVRVPP